MSTSTIDTYRSASTKGLLSRMLSRMVPAWENRPDSEHEQAVIRIIAGAAASAYVLFALWSDRGTVDVSLLIKILTFFFFASGIIAWLIFDPAENVKRRITGCILDNLGATALLYLNGNIAAPIFVVYLWVTFGNGFRFGKEYLFLSMGLSVLGFSSVMLFSNEWSAASPFNMGLFAGLIALPIYVASLLDRLEQSLKDAEVASLAKSNFLATMSHEIRTPLNGLIGVLNLLDMTTLNRKQRHYTDLMKNSSNWLLNVISDSLDFSKIEADELVLQPDAMCPRSLLSELCEVYKEIACSKGIAFYTDTPDTLPRRVFCDTSRLTQILNNLLNNACKFTEKGEVRLVVGFENHQKDKVRLSFKVIDSGIGIEKASLEDIFSPFKQANAIKNKSHGGTGLGLAISSRLIRLMGGDISVSSKLGSGTTFSFFLDVLVAPAEESEEKKSQVNGIRWKREPSILLVEDNEINQEVAATYLKYLGCSVRLASDGQEALLMMKDENFDLILMDCQMPRMDGYEATKRIRRMEIGDSKNIIIALTAHVTINDREKCMAAGMDDYMGKPYKVETLEGLLRKWLGSSQAVEEMSTPVEQHAVRAFDETIERSESKRQRMHDLRNALGGVLGGVELAMMFPDDQVKRERHLNNALGAVHRAVAMTSEVE